MHVLTFINFLVAIFCKSQAANPDQSYEKFWIQQIILILRDGSAKLSGKNLGFAVMWIQIRNKGEVWIQIHMCVEDMEPDLGDFK